MDMPPPSVPPMPSMPSPAAYQPPPPPPKAKFPIWAIVLLGCGGCGVLLVVIMAAVLFPVFAQAREKARQTACMSNMKMQGLAAMMYSEDYDEIMPKAKVWMDATAPYIREETYFHCPSVQVQIRDAYGYAFNTTVSQMSLDKLNKMGITVTPLIFESSRLDKNANDALISVINPPRHGGHRGNNWAYADGHVRFQSGASALTGQGGISFGSNGQFPAPGNGNP